MSAWLARRRHYSLFAAAADRDAAISYAYAGGQVVVWQSGGTTFTLVGDGAPDDVLVAARSVPHARALLVLDRIRRAALDVLRTA